MDVSQWLYTLLINSVAILITAYIIKGVQVKDFWSAVLGAFILGLINSFVRPVFVILTLPLTIITLGFFLLVINALMIMLASAILPGFNVKSFWSAFLFSIILSVMNAILFWIF